jgi:hypothetical protein
MRTSTLAKVAAITLAIIGVFCLLWSLRVATDDITVFVRGHKFKCGSVLNAKDPRELVSSRQQVTRLFKQANNRCDKKRSDQTQKAITLFVAGVIPLLIVLMIPALGRRSRMARGRRRTRL